MRSFDKPYFGSRTPLRAFDVPGDLGNAAENDPDPVIVINPGSSDDALLSSAMARAHRLKSALDALTVLIDPDGFASGLRGILYAASVEVDALLQEMWRRRHLPTHGEG